jgi:selT/selW/selH-like putative selenoprotein
LAAELRQAFPEVQVRLIQSSGGVFEVMADGQLVFSKKASRRHAAPGEVVQAIERLRGGK